MHRSTRETASAPRPALGAIANNVKRGAAESSDREALGPVGRPGPFRFQGWSIFIHFDEKPMSNTTTIL
jgi:hypothetical protein